MIVADGPSAAQADALDALATAPSPDDDPRAADDPPIEIVWTSERLGHAAAVNAGMRRATAPVAVLMDTSVEPTGDIVTPLVQALDDPSVAVAGGWGITSGDLRKFEDAPAGEVDAIEGYLQAFRRADYAARGPLDERFRFYRNLDIWWSLVLRDEGEGSAPRRAVGLDGLPAVRHEHRGYTSLPDDERDRQSKRNFYRIIDRFGSRRDLLVHPAVGRAAGLTADPSRGTVDRPSQPSGGPRAGRGGASGRRVDHVVPSAIVARARRVAVGDEGEDLVGNGRLGGLRLPDAMEVEAEDRIGIEDEPAALVRLDRRAQDLAQQRQRDRHVQVVVDRRDEAIVEARGRRARGERTVIAARSVTT